MFKFSKPICVLFLVFVPGKLIADITPYKCISNFDRFSHSQYHSVQAHNKCLGYIIMPKNNEKHKIITFPFVGSGELVVSPDNNSVVMLQTYINGHIDPESGKIFGHKSGEVTKHNSFDVENPTGLYIYHKHKFVRGIKLYELLGDKNRQIEQSTSHIYWLRDYKFSKDSSTLIVNTTTKRNLVISLLNGKILN